MKLVTYLSPAKPSVPVVGVLIGTAVAPLISLSEFYDNVPAWLKRADTLTVGTLPLSGLKLAPPVLPTAKIICVAINYVKHGAESNLPTPKIPNLFARWTSCLSTTGTPVPVPKACPHGLDWEVELAAIVGSKLIDADEAEAARGILGYTVFNDLSAREGQIEAMTMGTGQWALGKNPDASAGVGSIVATADSVDAGKLRLIAKVNGEVMQDGTTADMIFSVPKLLSFASRFVTLRPGDLIATGTPDGVGFGRTPRVYMPPGTTVEVEIEGICSITHPIVDSSHRG